MLEMLVRQLDLKHDLVMGTAHFSVYPLHLLYLANHTQACVIGTAMLVLYLVSTLRHARTQKVGSHE